MSATQTSSREQRWEFQTRQILINDETVRLYSLNRRTWSSEWRDIEDFDRRTRKAFVTGRHAYLKMIPDRPSKEQPSGLHAAASFYAGASVDGSSERDPFTFNPPREVIRARSNPRVNIGEHRSNESID